MNLTSRENQTSHLPRKPVIGLLGGIGSGKSYVARQFESLGCGVVSADNLAQAALNDPEVTRQLAEWWGPQVIDDTGSVSRKAVAAQVFNQPDQKARLEGLIHPRVREGRQKLHAQFRADPGIVAIVEDSPLLLETGLETSVDTLVFVESSRETRLQRVAEHRGWSEEEITRREKNQLPLDTKRKRADHVIVNEACQQDCFEQARRVLSQILQHFATV